MHPDRRSRSTVSQDRPIRLRSPSQISTASSRQQSILSRLSYTPSPERASDDDESKYQQLKNREKSMDMEKNSAKKGITQPKSREHLDSNKSTLAKANPCKTLNKVVNQKITERKSDQESTVVKHNYGEELIKVVNNDITEPNHHEERDDDKLTGAKQKSRPKKNIVPGKEGKQDVNSVQQKKTASKKKVARSKQVAEVADEHGKESVEGGKMSARKPRTHRNSKEEERDPSQVAGSNLSRPVSPSPEIPGFETPPTLHSSPRHQSASVEGNDKIECLCPFECGFQPSEITLMKLHILEEHSPNQNCGTDKKTIEEENIVRKTFLSTPRGLLTTSKFNKLLRESNYYEVIIPGNGFCFISALLISLAEQGIVKQMAVLAHDVMTEIRNHLRFYREFDDSSSEETFLELCSDFFQRGAYTLDVADLCIGATANALGVNLNIIQKNQKTFSLTCYDCTRYKSNRNVFILLYPSSVKRGKNLDAHYNCYVNKQYFKENEAEIMSRIVMPIEENEAAPTTSADTNVSQTSTEYSKA